MKVNETRHAYIDLTPEETDELCKISAFLERLTGTINDLERENIEWDIRSDFDEGRIFEIVADIKYFADKLIG